MNKKSTLTKVDLVDAVCERLGNTKVEAADLVELVFATIKAALTTGELVKLSGFGNFEVKDKRARTGRNPQTGAALQISARRVVGIHPSQVLRAEVNGGEPQ